MASCYLLLALSSPSAVRPTKVVGLGEVLWDVLPGKRLLGGAPSNFAVHAATLGQDAAIASRVGADDLGKEALALLKSRGVDTRWIQTSPIRPTGTVTVTLADDGQPDYVIDQGVAWDELDASDESWIDLAQSTAAVCFGTLSQRCEASRAAVTSFLGATDPSCVRVFDVNLRQDYYDADLLLSGMECSSVLKLNDEEYEPVLSLIGDRGTPSTPKGFAERVFGQFPNLALVVITLGEAGCLLQTRSDVIKVAPTPTPVVDTIGAGDAFTAALVTRLISRTGESQTGGSDNVSLRRVLDRESVHKAGSFAVRYAAHVCSKAGGMPSKPDWLYSSSDVFDRARTQEK